MLSVMMENCKNALINTCNFSGSSPAMADLPYPPIKVSGKNQEYADLLSVDYCGAVSEMSAITQYINNESYLSMRDCSAAKTILSIAKAEMMHLQKLGELIILLGADLDFIAKYRCNKPRMWTPAYLKLSCDFRDMLQIEIQSEKAAINQYNEHISRINDACINAVLRRIIKDEEYHIMLLEAMLFE